MSLISCPSRLQFKQDQLVDQHIGAKITDLHPSEPDRDGNLLVDFESLTAECDRQRVFINRLQKSVAELIINFIKCTDDRVRQIGMKKLLIGHIAI